MAITHTHTYTVSPHCEDLSHHTHTDSTCCGDLSHHTHTHTQLALVVGTSPHTHTVSPRFGDFSPHTHTQSALVVGTTLPTHSQPSLWGPLLPGSFSCSFLYHMFLFVWHVDVLLGRSRSGPAPCCLHSLINWPPNGRKTNEGHQSGGLDDKILSLFSGTNRAKTELVLNSFGLSPQFGNLYCSSWGEEE